MKRVRLPKWHDRKTNRNRARSISLALGCASCGDYRLGPEEHIAERVLLSRFRKSATAKYGSRQLHTKASCNDVISLASSSRMATCRLDRLRSSFAAGARRNSRRFSRTPLGYLRQRSTCKRPSGMFSETPWHSHGRAGRSNIKRNLVWEKQTAILRSKRYCLRLPHRYKCGLLPEVKRQSRLL
jgi:hypothetical protein